MVCDIFDTVLHLLNIPLLPVNGFEILQTVSSKTLPADTEHELDFASSSINETENRTFMCLFCEDGETVLGDAELITNHVKDVHGIELYICEVCGQIFQNPDSFSSHLDEHLASDDGDFQCEICNRIFNNREMFYHHKTTHVGEKKKSARNVPGNRTSYINHSSFFTNITYFQYPVLRKLV